MNPESKTVTFTKEKLRQLIERRKIAIKQHQTEFTFDGRQYDVKYAKYLVEYLAPKFE